MTAQLQLFMILGAVVLLLIIFAFLKRGLMSVQVQPALACAGRRPGHCGGVPLRNLRIAGRFVH